MTNRLTQRERVLRVLRAVRDGQHQRIPAEYIRQIEGEEWLSARYIKQIMLISECNGRISELRSDGFVVDTKEKDQYGFSYHRLISEPSRAMV